MSGTALDLRKVQSPGLISVETEVLFSGAESVRIPGREDVRRSCLSNFPFLTVTGFTILAPPPRPRPPLRFSFPLPALGILVSVVPPAPPLKLTVMPLPPPPPGLHLRFLLVSSAFPAVPELQTR